MRGRAPALSKLVRTGSDAAHDRFWDGPEVLESLSRVSLPRSDIFALRGPLAPTAPCPLRAASVRLPGHPDAGLIKPIQLRSAAQVLNEPAEVGQVLDEPAPTR